MKTDIQELIDEIKEAAINNTNPAIKATINLVIEIAESKLTKVVMKFKDAPIGARFKFIGDDVPEDVYVKIHDYDSGLVVQWNGNIQGDQSHCCWLDIENGYDFDTEIKLI